MIQKPQPIRAELHMLTSQSMKMDHLTAIGLKSLDILECDDRHIVFHMPSVIFTVETLVSLKMRLQFLGVSQSFSATGKVTALKKAEDGSAVFQVQLRQYDRAVWRKFLQAAEGESLRVEQIFTAIKGDV